MIAESEMWGDWKMRAFPSLTILVAVALVHGPNVAAGAEVYVPFEGEKTSWHGFDRYDFVMDEQTLAITPVESAADDAAGSDARARCILVVPKRQAPGNPWSWRDLHRDHQPPAEAELLARGFHLAFITPGPPRQRFRRTPCDQPLNVRRSSCCVPTYERLHSGRLLRRAGRSRPSRVRR
jgi:hypothetical protein